MQKIDVHLDRRVFSHDVALRAAHRHSDHFAVAIASNATEWIISLSPLRDSEAPHDICKLVERDALDEQLRESVRNQTGELQVALINAALNGAKLAPAEQ